jgi:hypothetical protein
MDRGDACSRRLIRVVPRPWLSGVEPSCRGQAAVVDEWGGGLAGVVGRYDCRVGRWVRGGVRGCGCITGLRLWFPRQSPGTVETEPPRVR